ncbi:hypothetical protein RQ831_22640 [Roseomonas gilardii]|uniref:MFS transporter n=1 Tax=Roseomonas gilardii TaxID=257708 RepID=A0A1L7AP00_9PROT|nr:hypothetical protein [Roseomonas gilardii]APT60434.1 hypothetical protein RGI145_24120 [Roseomonas gilardii]MDT8333856.1 hypothetical protein [Roseomonas gilardii]
MNGRLSSLVLALAIFTWGFGFYGQAIYLAELHTSRGWSISILSVNLTTYFLAGAASALIIGREFATEAFMRVLGLSTAFGQAAYALGPLMMGVLRDFAGYSLGLVSLPAFP